MRVSSIYLFLLGTIASLFFSFTFLINRVISIDGGHWYFSGVLRYFYTILFISIILILFKGFKYYKKVINEFCEHAFFWTMSGSIAFGVFYSLICYAANEAPAWIIATTWQFTIIASLIILSFFGRKISLRIWLCILIVFFGIILVNASHFNAEEFSKFFYALIPVLIASFSYPLGNQLIWEEKIKRKNKPNADLSVISNAFAKVLLLTIGSSLFWIILYFFTDAIAPSKEQIINVAYIAFFSGVIATSLFLYARSKASTVSQIVLVDATQAGEVFFSLSAEVLFLSLALPTFLGFSGILITIFGLFLLIKFDKKN